MKNNKFGIIFTLFFFIIALLKVFCNYFNERIDSIVVILLFIASIPWISKYLKSIEIFGTKFELVTSEKKREIDNKQKEVESSVNKTNSKNKNNPKSKENKKITDYDNSQIDNLKNNENDAIVFLVEIRFEIVKKIMALSKINKINLNDDSFVIILNNLVNSNILSAEMYSIIINVWPILDRAVHSRSNKYKNDDLNWLIDKTTLILKYLNNIS